MMDISRVENDLISEIKLNPLQAKIFLLVTCYGKMTPSKIAEKLKISTDDALNTAKALMSLGAFIDISETEFEAMHPRFTAVNMYRKLCKRENIEFKRNKIVDNIGVILEKPYDDARTK
jgi:sugar-specific transcriptional regulator TrmB